MVAAVCAALVAVVESRWSDAARSLTEILPMLARVGGSAAQREVVEETLLFCLVNDGRAEEARVLLTDRLDRRPSPLDHRRSVSLTAEPASSVAAADASQSLVFR